MVTNNMNAWGNSLCFRRKQLLLHSTLEAWISLNSSNKGLAQVCSHCLLNIFCVCAVGYISCLGYEPRPSWNLAALETLQITCVNWEQRLSLYISIWPSAGPSLSIVPAVPVVLLQRSLVASEILPSIMGGWQTGRCGHREKGTCLLALTTVSIQAA